MSGSTCAGLWVTGTGTDGAPRAVYLSHVVDNAETMRDYGAQCVVWQTAINRSSPSSCWPRARGPAPVVLGPEAFDAQPFLDLLAAEEPHGYGSTWQLEDRPVA
jgi:hypothetical protein